MRLMLTTVLSLCPNCSTIQMMVARQASSSKMGLGPYHRVQHTKLYQVLVWGAIPETQRELKGVLNDGVNPRDVKAEILPCGGDRNTSQSPSTPWLKSASSTEK